MRHVDQKWLLKTIEWKFQDNTGNRREQINAKCMNDARRLISNSPHSISTEQSTEIPGTRTMAVKFTMSHRRTGQPVNSSRTSPKKESRITTDDNIDTRSGKEAMKSPSEESPLFFEKPTPASEDDVHSSDTVRKRRRPKDKKLPDEEDTNKTGNSGASDIISPTTVDSDLDFKTVRQTNENWEDKTDDSLKLPPELGHKQGRVINRRDSGSCDEVFNGSDRPLDYHACHSVSQQTPPATSKDTTDDGMSKICSSLLVEHVEITFDCYYKSSEGKLIRRRKLREMANDTKIADIIAKIMAIMGIGVDLNNYFRGKKIRCFVSIEKEKVYKELDSLKYKDANIQDVIGNERRFKFMLDTTRNLFPACENCNPWMLIGA